MRQFLFLLYFLLFLKYKIRPVIEITWFSKIFLLIFFFLIQIQTKLTTNHKLYENCLKTIKNSLKISKRDLQKEFSSYLSLKNDNKSNQDRISIDIFDNRHSLYLHHLFD